MTPNCDTKFYNYEGVSKTTLSFSNLLRLPKFSESCDTHNTTHCTQIELSQEKHLGKVLNMESTPHGVTDVFL
jgi:hypothetical protein